MLNSHLLTWLSLHWRGSVFKLTWWKWKNRSLDYSQTYYFTQSCLSHLFYPIIEGQIVRSAHVLFFEIPHLLANSFCSSLRVIDPSLVYSVSVVIPFHQESIALLFHIPLLGQGGICLIFSQVLVTLSEMIKKRGSKFKEFWASKNKGALVFWQRGNLPHTTASQSQPPLWM